MTEREEQTECSKQLECACSAPRVLIDEYLDYLRTLNHSAHTMKAYGNDLMSFAHWCSETNTPFDAPSHKQIRRYLGTLDREGRSRRTANRHLSSLKGFYQWLMIAHGYPSNPAAVLQGAKQAQTLPKTISHEDMQRLLSVYASEEELERDRAVALRNQAVLELLYACGLRLSDFEWISLDRLHLDLGYLSVVGKGINDRRVTI